MPYWPGYTLVDSTANRVVDTVSNVIQEANYNVQDVLQRLQTIVTGVTNTLSQLATTGLSPQVSAGVAIADAVRMLRGEVTPTNSVGDYVQSIYGFTQPLLDDNTNLNYLARRILAAIDESDPGNVAVNLPATPPAGYGGGTSNAEEFTINSLYQFDNSYRGDDLNDAIESAHDHATMVSAQEGYLDSRNPYFALVGPSSTRARVGTRDYWGATAYPAPDAIDWSLWDGSQSLVSLLNSQETQYAPWDNVSPDGTTTPGVAWAHFYGYDDTHWRCLVYEWQLPLVSGQAFAATATSLGAPVWPGAANVTLGTPVSISNGASSLEACDGVIVAITAVPSDQGSYQFGSDHSYVHLGQLAFVDDSGDYEDGQNFGFAAGIITPKRMAHAAGFVMRVKSGVSGTVTPWVNA